MASTATVSITVTQWVDNPVSQTVTAFFTTAHTQNVQSVVLWSGASYVSQGDYTHAQLLSQLLSVLAS